MKIRYISPSPKAGVEEQIRNDIGRTLIAAGFAEEVALPVRGSAGWLAARQEQAALATAPSIHDTVPSAPDGIEWGIKQGAKQVFVLKRVDGQLFFLDGPPADCPAGIRQQWLDAASKNPEANFAALEEAKRLQDEQDRKDSSLGKRTILSAIFGNGKVTDEKPVEEPKVGVRYIKSVDGFHSVGNVSWVTQAAADELVRQGNVELIKK